jgi:ankyrin repeat protein
MKRRITNWWRISHASGASWTSSRLSPFSYWASSTRYSNLGHNSFDTIRSTASGVESFVTFRNPNDPNRTIIPLVQIGAASCFSRLADIIAAEKDREKLDLVIKEMVSKDPTVVLRKHKGKLLMNLAVEAENYAAVKLLLEYGSPRCDAYKLADNLFNRRFSRPKNNVESYILATEFVTLVWHDECSSALDLLAKYKTMPPSELYNFAVNRIAFLYKHRGSMPSHLMGLENPQALRPWLAELISGRENNLADLIRSATDKVQFEKDLKDFCTHDPHIVNKQMSNSYVPVDYAALLGKYFVAKLLIKYGAIVSDGYKVLIESSQGKRVTSPKVWNLTMYWAAIDYANILFAGDIPGSRAKLDTRFAGILSYDDKEYNNQYFIDLVTSRLASMCKMYGVPKHLQDKDLVSFIKQEISAVFPEKNTTVTTVVDKPSAKFAPQDTKSK